NDSFELREHEPMPGQEVPLLILLRIRRVVGVGLAPVPYGFGIGLILFREGGDDLCFLFPRVVPQKSRGGFYPMGIPPPGPGMSIVVRQSPHDLDSLRVFREHHLPFGTVHVVTCVRLLPSGRSRAYAVRAFGRNRAYVLQTSGRRSRAYIVHGSGRRSRTHIL